MGTSGSVRILDFVFVIHKSVAEYPHTVIIEKIDIEVHIMPDNDVVADKLKEGGQHLFNRWSISHHLICYPC